MNRRILLADDSLTIQKVVELTFADTDFDVIAVSSGDELVAKLAEVKPDIVICDIIMPGRDGYDVCQEIKSSPDSLHLPVILLTGTFEPFDRDRALAVGCSEIITKPFEAKRLVEAVEKLASGHEATPQPTAVPTGEPVVFDDGRVTPPREADEPDILADIESEYDLADTAVTSETGTQEPPADEVDEGLDFTESGFVEMETAGRERAEMVLEPPTDGLDFDLEGSGVDTGVSADIGMDTTPFSQEEIEPEITPDEHEPEPFAPPAADEKSEAPEPGGVEVFPSTEETVFDEPPAEDDIDQNLTTPIDVAAVMDSGEAISPDPVDFDDSPAVLEETDTSNADTQDLGPLPHVQDPEPSDTGSELSDADVDRIARRMLELAGDRIDRIAWEVLPDMAEIVVRERVREIEAEVERERS